MLSLLVKLMNGPLMVVFSRLNIIFPSITRIGNLLFCLIKQIKHWRAKIISRDFEAYPKNMGYLIAADSLHQIFCSKRIDHLPTKSITNDMQLLMEHSTDYILP